MMFLIFYFNSGGGGGVFLIVLDQEMQTLGYKSVVCKHIWIVVMSTGERESNGDTLLRCSMVVDGIKESRTRMGSTDTLLLF